MVDKVPWRCIYKKCTYKFFINLETEGTVLQHRTYLLSYSIILHPTLYGGGPQWHSG